MRALLAHSLLYPAAGYRGSCWMDARILSNSWHVQCNLGVLWLEMLSDHPPPRRHRRQSCCLLNFSQRPYRPYPYRQCPHGGPAHAATCCDDSRATLWIPSRGFPESSCLVTTMSQRRSFRTSVAVLLAVLAGQLQLCLAAAAPAPSAAEPISVQHTQNWDGIDGSWNTIPLRIGSPEQFTRAFVSTASQQTWAIFDQACIVNGTKTNTNASVLVVDRTCYEDRGRTFSTDDSSSFRDIGFYQLWLEKNLGLMGNGKYGYDDVGLGYATGDGPTLKNTTVGALITENFWLGHFGLNPKPTNFTAYGDPSPAYLTKLFEQKHIPSLAWGYTAGAQYRMSSARSRLPVD